MTEDGGVRWRYVFVAPPSGDVRVAGVRVGVHAGEPVAFALAKVDERTALFRTRDGDAWSELSLPSTMAKAASGFAANASTVGVWCNESGTSKIALSEDGGDTWVELASSPTVIHHLVVAPGALWAIDGERSVAVSFDRGESWRAATFDFRVEDILCRRDPRTACVLGTRRSPAGEDGGAVASRTTDGGATWTVVRDNGDRWCHGTAFAHPDGRFHYGAYDALVMSEDEGATWLPISNLQPTSLAAPPAGEGWFLAASFNTLYRVTPPPSTRR